MHDDARCFLHRRVIALKVPGEAGPGCPVLTAATADEVWHLLDDRVHIWQGLPYLERLMLTGLCVAGWLRAQAAGLDPWWKLVQAESDAESYHHLPRAGGLGAQDADVLQYFRMVRGARADAERAAMKRPGADAGVNLLE